MRRRVPFGEWLPDLPPLSNPGALTARNVVPEAASYRPLRTLVPYSSALPAAPVGAFWAQDDSNTVFVFAGTATGLYWLQGDGTWTDVTRITGVGAYTGVTNWEFQKFGERIIAVPTSATAADIPQYYDMGTSTDFDDLPGTPPQARHVAVVKDFVMLGDLAGEPATVHWSGFNSSELWTPSLSTMSDSQKLFGRGGRVQRIVPGDVGVVFREHSIHLFRPVGPPLLFEQREVEKQRGTPAPNSVVWSGELIFYYAHDGFYQFTPDGSKPIGHNRVNRWFDGAVGDVTTMRGAVDRKNRLVVWAFASSAGGGLDRLLIYNWGADRWSYGVINTKLVVDLASSGYVLDTLDTILSGGIDGGSILVDSSDYQGGNLAFTAFDSNDKLATFSGTPLAAEVDTKELSDADLVPEPVGQRVLMKGARPLVSGDSPTVTVSVGHRNKQHESIGAFDSPVSLNDSGDANVFRDARYHRLRATVTGNYDHIVGVEIDAVPTGRY